MKFVILGLVTSFLALAAPVDVGATSPCDPQESPWLEAPAQQSGLYGVAQEAVRRVRPTDCSATLKWGDVTRGVQVGLAVVPGSVQPQFRFAVRSTDTMSRTLFVRLLADDSRSGFSVVGAQGEIASAPHWLLIDDARSTASITTSHHWSTFVSFDRRFSPGVYRVYWRGTLVFTDGAKVEAKSGVASFEI